MLLTQKVVQKGHGFWDTVSILANPIHWFINVLQTIENSRQCLFLASYQLKHEAEDYEEIAPVTTRYKRLLVWIGIRRADETATQREKRIMGTYLQALALATDIKVSHTVLLHRISRSALSMRDQWILRYEIAVAVGMENEGRLSLALIALILYIFQAISAFVVTVGGEWSTVPGGRIAMAMFWHWMVAVILVSNTVGILPTKDLCRKVVYEAYSRAGQNIKNALELLDLAIEEENGNELDRLQEDIVQAIRDANRDLDQSSFIQQEEASRRCRGYILVLLAIIPIISPIINSLALLWYLPPTGPNCRFVLLAVISVVYIFNAICTHFFRSTMLGSRVTVEGIDKIKAGLANILNARMVNKITAGLINRLKDSVVAMSSTLLILLSACGLFNSCRCWSGIYNRSEKDTIIVLNNDPLYYPLLKKQFPAIFTVCLGFQFISFLFIRAFIRRGV